MIPRLVHHMGFPAMPCHAMHCVFASQQCCLSMIDYCDWVDATGIDNQ
jgi:hypothetical protein